MNVIYERVKIANCCHLEPWEPKVLMMHNPCPLGNTLLLIKQKK